MTETKEIRVIDLIPEEAQQKQFQDIPTLPHLAKTLVPHQNAVTEFEGQLERAKIENLDDFRKGEKLLRDIKFFSDVIKEDQAALTGNLRAFLRFIDSQFKSVKDRLDVVMRAMKQKMLKFQQEEQKRADEAAAAERKKAEDQALEAAAAAEAEGNIDEAQAIVESAIAAPPAQTAVRGIGTSVSTRWVGTAESPMEICKAIVAGNLPISIIKEFSRSNMNAFATQKKEEGVFHGIKVAKDTGMRVR